MAESGNTNPAARWPRCEATLRDGSLCDRAVSRDESGQPGRVCSHHAKLDELATRRRAVVELSQEGAAESLAPVLAELPEGGKVDVRRALADAAAGGIDLVLNAYLEALAASERRLIRCPHCQERFQAALPDYATRLKAADALVAAGYGKPSSEPANCASCEEYRRLRERVVKEIRPLSLEEKLRLLRHYGLLDDLRDFQTLRAELSPEELEHWRLAAFLSYALERFEQQWHASAPEREQTPAPVAEPSSYEHEKQRFLRRQAELIGASDEEAGKALRLLNNT
jgi:hypothetical protein